MASGRLLVVAEGDDLRGSLVFALEAEGFEVTARNDMPSLDWVGARRFDCTVLDQKSLAGQQQYESIAFAIKAHPVVLLAAKPHPWLVEWVPQVVETPNADTALTTAVRLAMQIQG